MDIELVIKIREEKYKWIKENILRTNKNSIVEAIVHGIPLPKGHGRLGDLDALREEVSSWGMNDYEPSDFIDEIDRADTIIKADKEMSHWIDDADHYICPICGLIVVNPNHFIGRRCPQCGFQDKKDKEQEDGNDD